MSSGAIDPNYALLLHIEGTPIHRYLPQLLRLLEQRQVVARQRHEARRDDNYLNYIKDCNKAICELLYIPTDDK